MFTSVCFSCVVIVNDLSRKGQSNSSLHSIQRLKSRRKNNECFSLKGQFWLYFFILVPAILHFDDDFDYNQQTTKTKELLKHNFSAVKHTALDPAFILFLIINCMKHTAFDVQYTVAV